MRAATRWRGGGVGLLFFWAERGRLLFGNGSDCTQCEGQPRGFFWEKAAQYWAVSLLLLLMSRWPPSPDPICRWNGDCTKWLCGETTATSPSSKLGAPALVTRPAVALT